MADSVVQFNNHKENHFSFDLVVEGLNVSDAEVRCVIKWKPEVSLILKCVHESGTKWTVKSPVLEMLEKTAYNFTVEVVADGYFFEPFRGTMDVVGTPEVYVRTDDKKGKKEEVKEVAPYIANAIPLGTADKTNPREKSIDQIAREMIAQQVAEQPQLSLIKEVTAVSSPAEPIQDDVKVDHVKNDSVKKILEDVTPSKKKKGKIAVKKGEVVVR